MPRGNPGKLKGTGDTVVAEIRRKAGLTQESMADLLGTSDSIISRLENGKLPISGGVAFAIASQFDAEIQALGLTAYDLVSVGRE